MNKYKEHALINANKVRKIQEIHRDKTFHKLVKIHQSLLFECIRTNKAKQFYFYTVHNFTAGFPILNVEQVEKITNELITRLKESKHLKIRKLAYNLLLVTWEIHERNEETRYINDLINSISIQIKDCMTRSEDHLEIRIPENFRFSKDNVAHCIKKVLVKNGYKVSTSFNTLYIMW